jgi:hypothetical protein
MTDILELIKRCIAVGMWKQEVPDLDVDLFHNNNRAIIDRMAQGWLDCRGDTIKCYARAMCYAAIGKRYEINRFDEVGELHYSAVITRGGSTRRLESYWDNIATYVKTAIEGMI